MIGIHQVVKRWVIATLVFVCWSTGINAETANWYHCEGDGVYYVARTDTPSWHVLYGCFLLGLLCLGSRAQPSGRSWHGFRFVVLQLCPFWKVVSQ